MSKFSTLAQIITSTNLLIDSSFSHKKRVFGEMFHFVEKTRTSSAKIKIFRLDGHGRLTKQPKSAIIYI